MKILPLLCLLSSSLFLSSCSNKDTIQLGVTTTLEDSGLLSILIPAFEQEHNLTVKPIVAGSGQIHELIKRGDIDTAITHDPEGEKKLLSEKTITQRMELMRNDFIFVGPDNDPAHIQYSLSPDEAFKKIFNGGYKFVSRNDQSGTHQMELSWLQKGKVIPPASLYIKTGTGMGETLSVAVEQKAYTLSDRGTWMKFANKQNFILLFENTELLPNQYSVLSLGKEKASAWETWLSSNRAKSLIINYRINNLPVFFHVTP